MNLRKLISGLLTVAAGITMSAQEGSTAYNFLNTTSSSRIYGLGGVNISNITGYLGSTDQNPGLLGGEMDNQLLVNYMRYLGDSNFAGARYARAAGDYGAWAIGVQYYGYGTIKGADENGILTGDFSPSDLSFTGTYSHDITDRLRGGATLKLVYSGYDEYSAFAVATDLGINYYDEERDMSLSFVVSNLGGQVKRFRDTYDRLPVDLRLGWSQSFGSLPIRFSVTAWNLTKWHLPYYSPGDGTAQSEPVTKDSFSSNLFRHLIFAADFTPSDKFYISLGYNYKTRTDMSTYSRSFISGFSLGAGLNVDKFGIGLAFAQPHTGGTTFMLNLRLDINDFLN
ncbi:MAG: type IX secretion system protein PorQ [Bacteroidales bacterium]|nr:type IX secretion system protein PorQ [Bacteroidales bacterium]